MELTEIVCASQGSSLSGVADGSVAQISNVPFTSPPFSQTLIQTVSPGVKLDKERSGILPLLLELSSQSNKVKAPHVPE